MANCPRRTPKSGCGCSSRPETGCWEGCKHPTQYIISGSSIPQGQNWQINENIDGTYDTPTWDVPTCRIFQTIQMYDDGQISNEVTVDITLSTTVTQYLMQGQIIYRNIDQGVDAASTEFYYYRELSKAGGCPTGTVEITFASRIDTGVFPPNPANTPTLELVIVP